MSDPFDRAERLLDLEREAEEVSTALHRLTVRQGQLRAQMTELRVSLTADDRAVYEALRRESPVPSVTDGGPAAPSSRTR